MKRMRLLIIILALLAIVGPTASFWSSRRRRRRPAPRCAVNNWSGWTCSPTCQQRRTRTKSRTGHSCPSLEEKKPIIIANWGNWGHCSNTCGHGSRIRRRSVKEPSSCGGAPYSCNQPLSETQSCYDSTNTDCRVSAWSSFGNCVPENGKCGPGKATRRRHLEQAPTCRGRACPSLTEEISCNAIACTCTVGKWSIWACSETCQKVRSRAVTLRGLYCPFRLKETASISISNWGNWGHCTNTCGRGTRTRQRSVQDPLDCGGAPYSCNQPLSETQSCYHSTNTDCRVSAWSSFGNCVPENGKCGPGKATRRRHLEQAPTCRGRACPSLTEEISCNAIACTCTVGKWSIWACSETCQKVRNRTETREGLNCPFGLKERASIGISNWGNWSHCTNTCGQGTRTRQRSVEDRLNCGGAPYSCDKSLNETQSCYDFRNTDCKVSSWTPFGSCVPNNGKCGPGKATRHRRLEQAPTCRGKACPPLTENISCHATACCTVSEWSVWSCSKTCQKLRTRTVTRRGPNCPSYLKETASISISKWGNWGHCTNTCGQGTRTRQRSVEDPPSCGGAPYSCDTEPLSETQSCHDFRNTDCKVSSWTPFGPCVPENGQCGPGKATRHRILFQEPICRGTPCPPLTEEISCHATTCCTVSEWSVWTCSETCQKLRSRTVTRKGSNCPPYLKERASISLYNWGNWGHCTNTCGRGTRTRQRSVEDPPNCGGAPYSCDAEPLIETQSCYDFINTDCQVSPWTAIGPCVPNNGKCGPGKATRHRVRLQAPICNGKSCPTLTEEIPCNAMACPVPCTLTEWTKWSRCSHSCGSGYQSRNRSIIAPAKHGGACERELEKQQFCEIGRRIDCQV